MEAAFKISFDDDKDLDVKTAALQSYLLSLEANSVNSGAIGTGDPNCNTLANGIIDSGASAIFVTSQDKFRNASVHKSQLRTPNGQSFHTSHLGKTSLPIGSKALHFHAIVAPTFGKDLIPLAQLTPKGNKVIFTKQSFLLLGPSESIELGVIIGEKGRYNLYRLKEKLTKPNSHSVYNKNANSPKTDSESTWKMASKKKGPRITTEMHMKQVHDTMNRTQPKLLGWF